jgi:outer membrane protein
MRKGKSIVASTLLALLLMAVFTTGAVAQTMKIGFIRDDQISVNYKAWTRAQEEFDTESRAWEEEAQAQETELNEMVQEYERQKLVLSEDKKREREATIRTKQESLQAFTRQVFGPGGRSEQKQAELIQPIMDNIRRAIEAVALEEGYDVIFTNASNLGYIKETYDVTDKVLEALETLE